MSSKTMAIHSALVSNVAFDDSLVFYFKIGALTSRKDPRSTYPRLKKWYLLLLLL